MFQRVTKNRKYVLLDDGTTDAVLGVTCNCGHRWEERISLEDAARITGFINDWLDDEPCPNCGK